MKKYSSLILAGALLASVAAAIGSTLWLGSLTVINNTTAYSNTNQVATLSYNPGNLQIIDTGLTATTALGVNLQLSLDGINFLPVTNFNPPGTNAGTYPWSPGALSVNVYERFAVVTTNSTTNGIYQP